MKPCAASWVYWAAGSFTACNNQANVAREIAAKRAHKKSVAFLKGASQGDNDHFSTGCLL